MIRITPNLNGKRCRKCSFMCFGANSRRNFFGHMAERHSRGRMERIKICNSCYFNCNSNLKHLYASHYTEQNCDGTDDPDFDLPANGPWILVSSFLLILIYCILYVYYIIYTPCRASKS